MIPGFLTFLIYHKMMEKGTGPFGSGGKSSWGWVLFLAGQKIFTPPCPAPLRFLNLKNIYQA
jgi:hypothetical protein